MNFKDVKIYTAGINYISDKLIFINNTQFKEFGFNINNNPIIPVINVNDAPNFLLKHNYNHWFPIIEVDSWGFIPFFATLRVVEHYVFNYQTKNFIVHCAAGIRRSPSVAYAIIRIINDDNFDKTKLITSSDGEKMYDFGIKRSNIDKNTLELLKIAHKKENRQKSLVECLNILYS